LSVCSDGTAAYFRRNGHLFGWPLLHLLRVASAKTGRMFASHRYSGRAAAAEQAAGLYRYVADLWKNADPELQPYVAEAHARLQRLGG
jgi:hypothetical protein